MASINRLVHPTGSRENKILERALGRQELSDSRFGGQRSLHREINRYYFSQSPPLRSNQPDRPIAPEEQNDQPDVFVPIPFTIIEQMLPTWLFQLFGSDPPLQVFGRTKEDHDNAQNVEELLRYDFQMAKVFTRAIPIGKQNFKYGNGIFKVEWRYDFYEREETWERTEEAGLDDEGKIVKETTREKIKKPVVRYDGPWLLPWSVSYFWPDPMFSEISEMRYCVAKRFADKRRLEWEDEMHRKLTGQALYQHLDKIPPMPKRRLEELLGGAGPEAEVANAMGWTSTMRHWNKYVRGTGTKNQIDPDNEICEITEYWSQDEVNTAPDRMVLIANGGTVIADKPNPYDDKRLPFGTTKCFPIENEFWAMGLMHPIKSLSESVHMWRNLMMRNAQYNANRVWAVHEDIDVPPNVNLFNPGDVITVPFHANGRPMAADLFQARSLPPEAYTYEDRLIMDIQRAVGSTAMIEPTADTATEANLQRSGAAVRERLMGVTGELDFLVEVGKFFLSRRQQFFDEYTTIRILGPKGATFKRLSPQDVAGEFDFMAVGSAVHPNRNVVRQQLLQALSLVGQNPVLMGITDMYELWSEVLKSFDFRYHERLLNPPTEKTWDPRLENIILNAGEPVEVEPTDNHEEHLQVHMQGQIEAEANGADPAVLEGYEAHQAQHQKFLAMMNMAPGASAPAPNGAGQMPGLKGYAGNTPNLENATETEGGLAARTEGF